MEQKIPTKRELVLVSIPIFVLALGYEFAKFLRGADTEPLLSQAGTFRYFVLALAGASLWLFHLNRERFRWCSSLTGALLLAFSIVGLYLWFPLRGNIPLPWIEIVILPFSIAVVFDGFRPQEGPDIAAKELSCPQRCPDGSGRKRDQKKR